MLTCSPLAIKSASAQQPARHPAAAPSSTTAPGWNLRWRKSEKVTPQAVTPQAVTPQAVTPQAVTPQAVHVSNEDVFARPPRQAQPNVLAQVGYQEPATRPQRTDGNQNASPMAAQAAIGTSTVPPANPMRREQPNAFQHAEVLPAVQQTAVQQTQYSEPTSAAPVGNYHRANVRRPAPVQIKPASAPTRMAQANDFFNNPFAEQSGPAAIAPQAEAPTHLTLTPAPQSTESDPADGFQLPGGDALDAAAGDQPSNALRGSDLIEPGTAEPALPTPDQGPSLRDLMKDEPEQVEPNVQPDFKDPSAQQAAEQPKSPSDEYGKPFDNPFNQGRSEREQVGPGSSSAQQRGAGAIAMKGSSQLSCEDFRERIASETIDKISLDPSPPFRPDLFDPTLYREKRDQFERNQKVRPWSDVDGRVMAQGRLIELAYEQAIIETEDGQRQEVPVNRLSEGDLGYLSENWGLPKECLIPQVAFTQRSWAPLTMTYQASNICSKPRYFEEVNLERYGHTAGPWLQPVVSSAHFFANIAVLPYKMGIHPPNECQYALGYYRPGNCAPWIVPPVPISARGALAQGAAMTGAFWLIP